MRPKVRSLFVLGILILTMSASLFAGKKTGAKHVASGTIASIDDSHVVINEKVKGKEQPMTFNVNSSTQKSGSLKAGAPVTIQYRTENNQNVATSVRERSTEPVGTAQKSSK